MIHRVPSNLLFSFSPLINTNPMKKYAFSLLGLLLTGFLMAGNVEHVYQFNSYSISQKGNYQSFILENTRLSGMPGQPMLPYQEIALMLPPGEKAASIEVIGENEVQVPGSYILYPKQEVRPISLGSSGTFLKDESVYSSSVPYPASVTGHLTTQYLNGYAFALCTFTPARYIPATGQISYYTRVTIRINTVKDQTSLNALKNISPSANVRNRVLKFSQNPAMMESYPQLKAASTNYQLLIITKSSFQDCFTPLISMYNSKSISSQIKTIEDITASVTGTDLQEKIRNYIKDQYQNNGIEYVLLGADAPILPARGFYCYVISGSGYEDSNIPADLYYSGMDGNYDLNGNQVYGEVADSADLLPDIAVSRMPGSDTAELNHMVHKSVYYQTHPVAGDFQKPFFVGEHLYDDPNTEGGDYMELLEDNHSDNGYYTTGIPSADNNIEKMYDNTPPGYSWTVDSLLAKINRGKSFIHHLGHANTDYVMRLFYWDITDNNFSQVNGIAHNYEYLYTQGCLCGSFDQPNCIATKMLTIHNFLVGGVFNSRYGWFDQGTTEGPSEHLQREFVNAMYTDTLPETHFGAAHMISKIKTAPWCTAPGEFEPGAQRWCHYCANALGDPACEVYVTSPGPIGISEIDALKGFTIYPNPASGLLNVSYSLPQSATVSVRLYNISGQVVTEAVAAQNQQKGAHTLQIGLTGLPSGTYFCRIDAGSFSRTTKFIIL
jgi:hypothetical protein